MNLERILLMRAESNARVRAETDRWNALTDDERRVEKLAQDERWLAAAHQSAQDPRRAAEIALDSLTGALSIAELDRLRSYFDPEDGYEGRLLATVEVLAAGGTLKQHWLDA